MFLPLVSQAFCSIESITGPGTLFIQEQQKCSSLNSIGVSSSYSLFWHFSKKDIFKVVYNQKQLKDHKNINYLKYQAALLKDRQEHTLKACSALTNDHTFFGKYQ